MSVKSNYKDLALISGNIGKLYEEGIPLLNILILIDELPLKKEYKSLLKSMQDVIKDGGTLQEAFKMGNTLIPKFFISMVDIGERTGKIVYVLKGLEIFYNKLHYIKKVIISSLSYPVLLSIALLVLGVFVLFFFIPNMANIYGAMGKEIPETYLNVISIREEVFNNPIITLTKVIIWGCIIPYFIVKNFFARYIEKLIKKIPICNLINEYIVIVLMSVIVNSGINIAAGLEYCCESELGITVSNNIKRINNDITSGVMLSEAMEGTNMFSKYTLAHVKLGEESGSLDKRLELLEEEVFKNLNSKINKLTQLIQPLLILFIGVVIVVFIIKFIMPLLDIVL
ncbi:type II secretion system F family protein [Clostridioides difficile]